MDGPYRRNVSEPCDICKEKDLRIHLLESHDLDVDGIRKQAMKRLMKMAFVGLMLVMIGASAVSMGIWTMYEIDGPYGFVVSGSIWAFGAFMFLSTIIGFASYVNQKDALGERVMESRRETTYSNQQIQSDVRELRTDLNKLRNETTRNS